MKDGFGFGYYRKSDGSLVRKENKFDIWLGEGVEIGINTVIDKGSWRDTTIGEGTKLDNNIHIGHNAKIGSHCLVVAGTVVGGSAEIGDYSYIGMNCSILDRIKIGRHCIVGAGSVVTKNLPDYSIVAGNPARDIKDKCTMSEQERFNMAGY